MKKITNYKPLKPEELAGITDKNVEATLKDTKATFRMILRAEIEETRETKKQTAYYKEMTDMMPIIFNKEIDDYAMNLVKRNKELKEKENKEQKEEVAKEEKVN